MLFVFYKTWSHDFVKIAVKHWSALWKHRNITYLIEFTKYTSHKILNERVFIIMECQYAPYIVPARCYRNYFYVWCLIQFLCLVETVFFFLHPAQQLCEQCINIATLQEQSIMYKGYLHIKAERSRLQIGLSSTTMLSTSWWRHDSIVQCTWRLSICTIGIPNGNSTRHCFRIPRQTLSIIITFYDWVFLGIPT